MEKSSFYQLGLIFIFICISVSTESLPQKSILGIDQFLHNLQTRLSFDNDQALQQILQILEDIDINSPDASDDWLLESYTNQNWNSSFWLNDSSVLYFYNQYNLIEERIIRNWVGGQWREELKYLLSYDNSQRLQEEKFQYYASGQWIDSLRTIKEYNSMGKVSTETTFHWNGFNWINLRLTTSTYSGGQLIQTISQNWSGTEWENSGRTTYTYHSDGTTATSALSIWLFGTWINLLQIVFSLNSDGLLSEIKIQFWDFISGWANLTRLVITYDDEFRVIEGKQQDWDFDLSSWVNHSRVTSTYDPDNLLTNNLRELWIEGNWIVDARYNYEYDSDANRERTIYQLWSSGNWINKTRELYTYTKVTSIEEIDLIPQDYFLSQNYPNPFNPVTGIRYTLGSNQYVRLIVYNVLGNTIATLVNEQKPAGTYEVKWNAPSLPSGIYFYRIQAGDFIETKKMILLK